MTDPNLDIQRLRKEYDRRAANANGDKRYSSSNPAYLWMMAARQQVMLEFLEHFQKNDLSNLRILEIGCGSGGVLQEFISLGAEPSKVYGVDLLYDRLQVANEKQSPCHWINANGEHLPLPSNSFDMVLQFTAFSSILDYSTKVLMAAEMMRVLQPGRGILWYDFIWNPINRQTRGIPLSQIKKLFPGTQILSRRITLAPPLSRLLVPGFQPFADRLSRFAFLNSHLIVWIQNSK